MTNGLHGRDLFEAGRLVLSNRGGPGSIKSCSVIWGEQLRLCCRPPSLQIPLPTSLRGSSRSTRHCVLVQRDQGRDIFQNMQQFSARRKMKASKQTTCSILCLHQSVCACVRVSSPIKQLKEVTAISGVIWSIPRGRHSDEAKKKRKKVGCCFISSLFILFCRASLLLPHSPPSLHNFSSLPPGVLPHTLKPQLWPHLQHAHTHSHLSYPPILPQLWEMTEKVQPQFQ